MKSCGNNGPARASRYPPTGVRNGDESAVIGNGRTTALAGAVLLVLFLIEIVTVLSLRGLLRVHVLVGVLLVGPLVVKLGSTGYRFVRYYTGSPAFVRRGPPRPALRILAPLLLVTTLVVIGTGIALLIIGPTQAGLLVDVHGISTLLWLPMLAIHVFAYTRLVPRHIADDWRKRPAEQIPGRGLRLGMILGAVMVGALAAILVLPSAASWITWFKTTGKNDPAPVIVGLVLTAISVLAVKLLGWVKVEG